MPCQIKDCQFQVPESQLISFSNLHYCIFHTLIDKKGDWGKEKKESFNKEIDEYIQLCINEGKGIDFSYVVFPTVIEFSGKKFPNISFAGADFAGSAIFMETQFEGTINFEGVIFRDSVSFTRANFSREVSFNGAQFCQGGDFENTKFTGYADFRSTKFEGPAFFLDANFCDLAIFSEVNFRETVNFSRVKFKNDTLFINTDFGDTTEFFKTQFEEFVDFSKIIRGDRVLGFPRMGFNGSSFGSSITFNNRSFLASTNFEKCTFIRAPNFHNCNLHQDTVFPPERFFKDTNIEGAVSAYRTLKFAMENVRARREEGMFYALDQKSLRNDPEVSKTAKFFSWLYEKTADYGQSMGKPLACLGGVTGGFFVLYFAIACAYASQTKSYWELALKTLGFSFKQAFQPFYVLRQPSLEWLTDITGIRWVKALATLESLFILGLFALFLLCVRWNFKRG
ncbi:MAG: hypothetical protein ACI8PD_000535 [Nitrospinales bacterium]|jgi:uncharacterized protein YjbI with pentapeptide repeats